MQRAAARVAALISPAMLLQQVRTDRPAVILLDLDLGISATALIW
jgi:hypothetical protein